MKFNLTGAMMAKRRLGWEWASQARITATKNININKTYGTFAVNTRTYAHSTHIIFVSVRQYKYDIIIIRKIKL